MQAEPANVGALGQLHSWLLASNGLSLMLWLFSSVARFVA
jgi:hypothetical protein